MKSMKEYWLAWIPSFCEDKEKQLALFEKLKKAYSHRSRAYHNLTHINSMLDLSTRFIEDLEDPDLLLCSIWYHDLIYNALRKDNELKSANKAKEVLEQLNCSPERIARCHRQIMLTKNHKVEVTDSIDERLLIDFDLEILSRDWNLYETYTKQIRKEYWMYPGPIYRKGRKEAMIHFLERDFIYQTEIFRSSKEEKARENIKREIEEL